MILKDNDTTIEQIGLISEEAQFKMKASRKAFQILSDLYSDKPLAIVRELGCNAFDSMVASGNGDKPFHIHLPNTLEPWITIQDFGTGISHDNIYSIYTTYFESTKTNTNNQIGCLGLGSKSPFCYTDNFTITSIHNGEKRIYNAYFNASSMPTISLMSCTNTSEDNGVAIKIPVKPYDFDSFKRSVYTSFRYFDVRPTISGGVVEWDNLKEDFSSTFWKSYVSQSQSYAVMGGVTYPIDHWKVSSDHTDILRKGGLVIKFEIGELDFTPSRESLSYCESTVKMLNYKVGLVKKDFLTRIEEKIKTSDNLLDAIKAYYLLNSQWSFLNSNLLNRKTLWKDIDLSEASKTIRSIAPDVECYCKRTYGRSKWSKSDSPSFNSASHWYVNDVKRGGISRVVSFVKKATDLLYVNLVNPDDMSKLIKIGFPASAFIPVSTIPADIGSVAGSTTKVAVPKPKGVICLYTTGIHGQMAFESHKFDLSKDTPPKYYYVKNTDNWEITGLQLNVNDGEDRVISIKSKYTLEIVLHLLGLDQIKVKMVSPTNVKHLEALGSKSFSEFLSKNKITVKKEHLAWANQLQIGIITELYKAPQLPILSAKNPFRLFVEKFYREIPNIQKLLTAKQIFNVPKDARDLTFPSALIQLLYVQSDRRYDLDLVFRSAALLPEQQD
jgi:hypothetical protein